MAKTLIFDFDGTIADSFETLLEAFEDITRRPQKLTAQEVKDLRGKKLKQIIKYLKIKPWQIPRLILQAKPEVKRRMHSVKPFDGLPSVLKQLHKDGHQMFILSTNDPATIRDFLSAYKLESCFDAVRGNIGLGGKAGALKKAIKAHKLNKKDCVYIGDEVRDVQAAKKAGIAPVSVGWGFNYPKALEKAKTSALAHRPKDLLKILAD